MTYTLETLTEDELFEEHKKLITITIKRKLSNYPVFTAQHGLNYDDLHQFGRVGLLKAIRNYDITKGASFRTYAINTIYGTILSQARKNSLYNTGTQTFDLSGDVSMNDIVGQDKYTGADIERQDFIADEKNAFEEIEDNIYIEQMLDKIKADPSIPERVYEVIQHKLSGKSVVSIAKLLGVSRQALEGQLERHQHKIYNAIYQVWDNRGTTKKQ